MQHIMVWRINIGIIIIMKLISVNVIAKVRSVMSSIATIIRFFLIIILIIVVVAFLLIVFAISFFKSLILSFVNV
jgi:hypothetical protein